MQITRKRERTLVGLEIEADSIAATEVRANGSSRVTATAIQPLATEVFRDGEVVDPAALTDALKSAFSEHKLSKRVRLGLANQRVIVRTLRLPAIEDPKELDAAVRFQAQDQIPMPIDQAVLDHRVVGGVAPNEDASSPKIDVVVVAARRDMIEASLAPIRDAGLQPVGVDLAAFGMIRALRSEGAAPEAPAEQPSAVLYCNIGDVTNLAVAKGRSCLFTRVAPSGMETMASGLSSTAGLTPEHARMWLGHVGLAQPPEAIGGDPAVVASARSTLEGGASALQDELRLSLDFYAAQEAAFPVDRVVLSGPGGAIQGLSDRLEAALGLPFEVGRPAALSELDEASAARLTLSYGLALEDSAMRPVNLIPEDQRRSPGRNRRGGPLAFILVGALIALLAGVTLLVTTGNEISSEKAEAVELEAKNTAAEARVSQLAAYTQLHKVHDQRLATVTSLADSRFDWEQVMRELSLILPGNVWLTNLVGTVQPDVTVNGGAGIALRTSIPGPALEIVGCATSQDAVAGFVSNLKDIEGVTRVGVQYSKLPESEGGSGAGESEESSEGGNCQTKDFIAQFQIVAAFDAAPVPATEAEAATSGESEIAAASESPNEGE